MSKQDYIKGYNAALKDVHEAFMSTYQANFDWDDVNGILTELGGEE